MSETTELKPCAHCGSDKAPSTIVSAYNGESFTYCDNWNGGCGVQTKIFKTPQEAIAAWNTRTQPALPEAPEGWQLVPLYPDYMMKMKAYKCCDMIVPDDEDGEAVLQDYFDEFEKMYRGMLGAAPKYDGGHKGDAQDMVMVSVDLLDDAISVIGKQTECINSYAADASDTPGMIGIDFKFVDETEQKLIKAIKDAQKEQGHG